MAGKDHDLVRFVVDRVVQSQRVALDAALLIEDLGVQERVVAAQVDGQQLTEPLLNQIEVAIRAYDPCLSCATHALGKMPLEVELLDVDGGLVSRIEKNASGVVTRDRTAREE